LLAEQLKKKGARVSIVLGAGTGKECLFAERLKKTGKVYITTDDGSLGEKGFVTAVLEGLLKKEKFDCVFCCGPEAMMKAVFELCEKFKVKSRLNLERFMRCGFGICGACAMGKWLVCSDGPVFTEGQLRETPDFGKSAMLKSGKNVSLKEFADWRQ
jgi:dihydroorotate dehydrogenase electron transfer subunit